MSRWAGKNGGDRAPLIRASSISSLEQLLASAEPERPVTRVQSEGNLNAVATPGRAAAQRLRQSVGLLTLGVKSVSGVRDMYEARLHKYDFWNTQPVQRLDQTVERSELIVQTDELDRLNEQKHKLPSGLHFGTFILEDNTCMSELCALLSEHYIEDLNDAFRFEYKTDYLRWALGPVGFVSDWHVSVRSDRTNQLCAFVAAVPISLRIRGQVEQSALVNYLCVARAYRSQRIVPALICTLRERLRQHSHIRTAVYSAGVILPKPFATSQYWHRPLAPIKLIQTKFCHLQRGTAFKDSIDMYSVPETTSLGFRALRAADLEAAHELLEKHLQQLGLAPSYTTEQFQHLFMPTKNLIDTYVIEQDDALCAMISYYTFLYGVTAHPTHRHIKAATLLFCVADTPELYLQIATDALVQAKIEQFDVFNALDIMQNTQFLRKLKFGVGEGSLNYYLYNWRCPDLRSTNMALIIPQ